MRGSTFAFCVPVFALLLPVSSAGIPQGWIQRPLNNAQGTSTGKVEPSESGLAALVEYLRVRPTLLMIPLPSLPKDGDKRLVRPSPIGETAKRQEEACCRGSCWMDALRVANRR